MVRRAVRGDVEDRAVWGSMEASDWASGPPDAPILPTYPWTRAFGPSPIPVQEARAGSPSARSTLIWEIPVKIRMGPGHNPAPLRLR
jgi:hypothetical protein